LKVVLRAAIDRANELGVVFFGALLCCFELLTDGAAA
jgi:hypothetical protein